MANNVNGSASLLEADIEIVGDISFNGELYLQGRVNGNIVAPIESSAALYVQEQSEVIGEIRAPRLIIAGKVSGDIFASSRISIKASAEIFGNIHYSELEMEEGASVNGTFMALGRPEEAQAA